MFARKDTDTVFDEIESLRTEYLRELTALSKVLIAISSAALGLFLSPFGIELSLKVGLRSSVVAWVGLGGIVALGFLQIFMFSSRFRSKAEYLWASHIADTIVQLKGPEVKLNEFLAKSDQHRAWYERKYFICVALVVAQGVVLLAVFVVLALAMHRIVPIPAE